MQSRLKKLATEIRIREMEEFKARGFGHVGGALSITDCLAALYGEVMKFDPKNPQWEDRDRLVMSKGHAGPALYATLAVMGFFPIEMLATLNANGTKLPSHCDKNLTPGIDMTTGSLGQGASTAAGLALGLKAQKKDSRVYLILGDGEAQEGQVWEMALFAPQHKLNNLIAFIDFNKRQLDGYVEDICNLEDLGDKFKSFGWYTLRINGNDPDAVVAAVNDAKANQGDKPAMIILDTIKGAGVKEVEDTKLNHHLNISAEQADAYIAELKAGLE